MTSKHIVIVVNGAPRVGKDTTVKYMIQAFEEAEWHPLEYSSIQPVMNILEHHFDLSKKTEADRALIAEVKQAVQKHSNFCTKIMLNEIDYWQAQWSQTVVFLHIREAAEIEWMRNHYRKAGIKFVTVIVGGPRGLNITSNAADANWSQTVPDYMILNGGTLDDLERACFRMARTICEDTARTFQPGEE